MMKKIVLVALFIGSVVMASAQGFPSTDSLRNYNTRFTTNSAITWFTNLRGQTLLRGIIDYIDTAKNGAIDTAYKTGDTLYIKTKKPKTYKIYIAPGGGTADSVSKPGYASKRYVDSVFNSGDTIVINNLGLTGYSLARSSNDTLHFKKLVAGTNVTLSLGSDSAITISSSAGAGSTDTATISSYYFKNGGNNFASTATIGTNTAQDLAFKAGNVELGRFSASAGQLLIGTTTTSGGYKFIVNGYALFQGQETRMDGGARIATRLNTGTSNSLIISTNGTPSNASSSPIFTFTSENPGASTGVRQQTLVDMYKPVQRGASGFDSIETVLKVRAAIISGVADDVRGIWQDYGSNYLNTSYGSTHIGYSGVKRDVRYKLNVNGSVLINKDSLPASTISSASFVGIDNTTGQLVKLSNAETTYTPTITNVTNVGTSSVSTCYYRRIGDVVDVFGEITIDPTATGDTELRISLPISAPLGFSYQLSGQATTFDNVQSIRILGDVTNDAATFRLNASVDAASHVYSFHIIYYIPGA